MSERRKKTASRNKIIAYTAAIAVHVVIIGAMLINFSSKPKEVVAFDADKIDVVKATTIDESEIKKQQDKIKQKDRDKKRKEQKEKQRLEDLKKAAEREKQRIADLKKQQQEEKAKAVELEKQRKAIALKKQQEKAKREKEEKERLKKLAEKKKREEIAAQKKRAAQEAERLKKEQQAKEAQDRLERLLAEEDRINAERLAKERTTTISGKYASLIQEKVNKIRTIAPDFQPWLAVKLNIKLSSDGDVLSVSVVESSGNPRYDRDAETAVRKATPLPIPTIEEDEEAHKLFQDVTLKFSMPGAG